jgi:hypothetical protein
MLHDQLVQKIQKFGADARESRQVYKRLCDLLQDRTFGIAESLKQPSVSITKTMRLAYTSREFKEYIEEIVNVGAESLEARIQFETHMMLIDARRTLRKHLR